MIIYLDYDVQVPDEFSIVENSLWKESSHPNIQINYEKFVKKYPDKYKVEIIDGHEKYYYLNTYRFIEVDDFYDMTVKFVSLNHGVGFEFQGRDLYMFLPEG